MSDKLRLRFEKTGRAVYISHLDLMHTMQRAFNRAGYHLKYSEGFNPHPQIAIALPLSVGTASLCEIMDFKLKEEPELSELPRRLTAVMPEGIRITEAYEFTRKVAELKWLQIQGRFDYDERDPREMAEALQRFYEQEAVVMIDPRNLDTLLHPQFDQDALKVATLMARGLTRSLPSQRGRCSRKSVIGS